MRMNAPVTSGYLRFRRRPERGISIEPGLNGFQDCISDQFLVIVARVA